MRTPSAPDSARLRQLADSLLAPWTESGHLLARIRLNAQGTTSSWQIEPGPTFQWRTLNPRGDSTYDSKTLMRLGGIRRGDIASPGSLVRAAERVRATGCAEVTSPPRLTGQRGTTWADAWLAVSDIPCSQADLAMGWESAHGAQGQGDVLLSNLLGTARSARLAVSSKGGYRAFSLDWHEPWIGDWDLALDAQLRLQQSPARQLQQAKTQGRWPARIGTWDLGAQAWSTQTRIDDTSIAHSSAWGSSVGWTWSSNRPKRWMEPPRLAGLGIATLRTRGTPQPWLIEGHWNSSWGISFPGLALALRIEAQALLPLDSLSASGSSRSLGGAGDWKGHREGQFQTPQWLLGEAEARFEAGDWGAALFAAPGAAWIWRGDGPHPHPGYGYGLGLHWIRGSSEARLDLAAGEDTRDWQDALLHLVLTNRF